MNHWPAQLRAAREAAGLTQRQLAVALVVKQPTVADFENDEANLSESTVRKFAAALGLEVALVLRKPRRPRQRAAAKTPPARRPAAVLVGGAAMPSRT